MWFGVEERWAVVAREDYQLVVLEAFLPELFQYHSDTLVRARYSSEVRDKLFPYSGQVIQVMSTVIFSGL